MAASVRSSEGLRSAATPVLQRSFSSTSTTSAPRSTISSLMDDITRSSTRDPPTRPAPRTRFPTENTDGFMDRLTRPGPRSLQVDNQKQALESTRLQEMARTMSKRKWKTGDVYAPHDLSATEAKKWQKRIAPEVDIFDQLAINPLDEWKNPAMMFEFQSSQGKILKRNDTGLRPVNQRRIARAIRRGVGMGFLPSVHAHPELLRRRD